ncbi:MAG: FG-GAP-like repeat-containing protein, partial [Xanthobacteraceae bacterium]
GPNGSGPGWSSRLTYTASAGATYYLASDPSGNELGTYRISATSLGGITDDYAGSTATTGVVGVGGSTTGSIETTGDADWFAVTLVAGKTYRFDLEGSNTGQGTLQFPSLQLRDSSGNFLLGDSASGPNGSGPGWSSRLIYAASAGGIYHLASDPSGNELGTYKLSVTDLGPSPNNPPVITSNGGGDTATLSILENTPTVTTVTATDPDAGTTLTYSITGGADAALFQLNASTGALSFKTAPNFEQPTDADHNNSYIVQVAASDGALSDNQIITVNVTDMVETTPSVPPHWIATSDIGSHPAGWAPVSTADFNHDATADILWFNSSNLDVDLWKLSNAKWAGSVDIGAHPAGYNLIGPGDFNHDGTPDLLWYNPGNGDVDIWKIVNGQWAGSVSVGSHPLGARPLGDGDYNGDGTGDVLWYDASSNAAEVWMMQNGQWAGSVDIGAHPAGWQPFAGIGMDNDGTSDILWYNPTTRDVDVWKIVNGHWAGSFDMGTHPAGYAPGGVGDFNNDGSRDILWFNPTTGNTEIWLLQNGHWAASVDVGNHPTGWSPAGTGDFNHDGNLDILWRDAAGNHVEAWLLSNS